MGEKQNGPFQLSFNASLKIDFQGSRVTSDGGLILVRELDERLGFGELIAQHLSDARRGKNTQLPLADLFRQSVYSRIAGYEDVEMLAEEENFASLARINRELIAKAEALDSPQRVVLDMDSTEIPVYGQQEEIYEALEERGVKYAIRLPANENLERDIAELLTRPVGRPSHKPVV
jgi:hypothetical protein